MAETKNDGSAKDATEAVSSASFPTGITAENIGNVGVTSYLTATDGGLYYDDYESDKYGIINFDGSYDSGAIYSACEEAGKYFAVAEKSGDISKPTSLNCVGLVDADGNQLVPFSYASIQVLSDRYAKVSEVTKKTTKKDNALVYYSKDGGFSIQPKDDDYFFEGNWYIYDLQNKEIMNGITGEKATHFSAYGDILEYTTDNNEEHTVGPDGEDINENADIFENGTYALDNAVFDGSGNEIFTFQLDSFIPKYYQNGYYIASKYTDNGSSYVVMDKTGNIVSTEFSEMPTIEGTLLEIEEKIMNFNGTHIIDSNFSSLYLDDLTKQA